jgi:hypothetical protein
MPHCIAEHIDPLLLPFLPSHLEVECVVAVQVHLCHDALKLTISNQGTLAAQTCTTNDTSQHDTHGQPLSQYSD